MRPKFYSESVKTNSTNFPPGIRENLDMKIRVSQLVLFFGYLKCKITAYSQSKGQAIFMRSNSSKIVITEKIQR